jgi:hypothetical protein
VVCSVSSDGRQITMYCLAEAAAMRQLESHGTATAKGSAFRSSILPCAVLETE